MFHSGSAKTDRLLEELRTMRKNNPASKVKERWRFFSHRRLALQCIIFSQWTMMLDLVEIPLKKEYVPLSLLVSCSILRSRNFKFLRLDGALSQPQREKVLDTFAKDGSVTIMLISLKAGGVGLNLVTANFVFFLDAWWNPAVEDQAIQRVHRIGQTKTVFVKRFIVDQTVEERILALQQRKKFLAGASLGMTQDEAKAVRLEDLKSLFMR